MNRSSATLLTTCLLGTTCACASLERAPEPRSASSTDAASARPRVKNRPAPPVVERQVGQYVVQRFSGSFRQTPVVLTEEVLGRDRQSWLVELTLTEGEHSEKLRVRFDAATAEPLSVTRLADKRESAASIADYQALMARTMHAADVNEGLVKSERATCLIGPEELDCETKTYRVWLGETPAELSITSSHELPGRDLAGEIMTEDGQLVYRAEVLEAKRVKPARGLALAR